MVVVRGRDERLLCGNINAVEIPLLYCILGFEGCKVEEIISDITEKNFFANTVVIEVGIIDIIFYNLMCTADDPGLELLEHRGEEIDDEG